jgi:hypothetical protein
METLLIPQTIEEKKERDDGVVVARSIDTSFTTTPRQAQGSIERFTRARRCMDGQDVIVLCCAGWHVRTHAARSRANHAKPSNVSFSLLATCCASSISISS